MRERQSRLVRRYYRQPAVAPSTVVAAAVIVQSVDAEAQMTLVWPYGKSLQGLGFHTTYKLDGSTNTTRPSQA